MIKNKVFEKLGYVLNIEILHLNGTGHKKGLSA
jgi:hypothetical protein